MRKTKWIIGDPINTPAANTILANYNVPMGKRAYIMGFFISTTDPAGNTFSIAWVHNGITKTLPPLVYTTLASIKDSDLEVAYNEGFSADPQSIITVKNVSNASTGIYQANMLIAEEYV